MAVDWIEEEASNVLTLFEEKGVITTRTMTHCTMRWFECSKRRDAWEHNQWFAPWVSVQRMIVLCNEFHQQIWEPWLRDYYLADPEVSSHAGTAGGCDVLVMASACRLLITLQRSGEDAPYLSLITEDPDSQVSWSKKEGVPLEWRRLGVQGVTGTVVEIEAMLRSVLDNQDELRETMSRHRNYLA